MLVKGNIVCLRVVQLNDDTFVVPVKDYELSLWT